MENEKALVGVVELEEAKRIRSQLSSKNIVLEFVHNPETCTSKNCKPSVEVYVPAEQIGRVLEFLKQERENLLAGVESLRQYAGEVFDTEKANAICPACGTSFATTIKECPDCGLVFMTDETRM